MSRFSAGQIAHLQRIFQRIRDFLLGSPLLFQHGYSNRKFKSMGKFSCIFMPSECSEPCFFIPLHSFIAFSCPHQDPAATWVEAGGKKPRKLSLALLSRTLCEPNSPAEVYLVCLRGEEGAERALCCSRVGAGWKHLLPVSSSVTSMQMEARCTEP